MSHPLNDVVWCKLAPSPIHGVGVFAIRDIPKGTELAGGGDYYERGNEADILPEIMALMRDRWCRLDACEVLPNPNWDAVLQRFMNHSKAPNSDGVHALEDIRKGDEITEAYTSFDLGPEAIDHYKKFL